MELGFCPAPAASSIEYLSDSWLAGIGLVQENTCPAIPVGFQHSAGSIPPLRMDFGDIVRAIGGGAFGVLVLMLGAIPGAVLHVMEGCLWIIAPVMLAALSVTFAVLRFIISPLLIPWRMAVFCYTLWLDIYDELEARTTSCPPPSMVYQQNILRYLHDPHSP